MDKIRLEYEIKSRGHTIDEFCKSIEISRAAYYRKCKGTSEFTQSEIKRSIDFLQLESPMEIFFGKEVS